MKEIVKNIKVTRCSECPGQCSVDKATYWIYREIGISIPHDQTLEIIDEIKHNSGLVGKTRTTRDNGSRENITHQIKVEEPCNSRIVVHTFRFDILPGDLSEEVPDKVS